MLDIIQFPNDSNIRIKVYPGLLPGEPAETWGATARENGKIRIRMRNNFQSDIFLHELVHARVKYNASAFNMVSLINGADYKGMYLVYYKLLEAIAKGCKSFANNGTDTDWATLLEKLLKEGYIFSDEAMPEIVRLDYLFNTLGMTMKEFLEKKGNFTGCLRGDELKMSNKKFQKFKKYLRSVTDKFQKTDFTK